MVKQEDGSYLVDSKLSPEQIAMGLSLDLGQDAEEHYRPLAALLVEKFGEVPREGENISLYGALLTIVKVEGHTIVKVRVTPDANENTEEKDTDDQ